MIYGKPLMAGIALIPNLDAISLGAENLRKPMFGNRQGGLRAALFAHSSLFSLHGNRTK